jgi:hypothetical protein
MPAVGAPPLDISALERLESAGRLVSTFRILGNCVPGDASENPPLILSDNLCHKRSHLKGRGYCSPPPR